MSLCDLCFSPGACCKRIRLHREGGEVVSWLDEGLDGAKASGAGFGANAPFVPIEVAAVWHDPKGREYAAWWWRCDALTLAGRCSIYEDRPQLCRNYEPMSDGICVHAHGDAGDASAPQHYPPVRLAILDSEAFA